MSEPSVSELIEQQREQFYDLQDSTNACFVCSDPRYSTFRDCNHFEIEFTFNQCQCGLIKQTPMPTAAFFEWFFNSDLFFSSKQTEGKEIWGFYDYFRDEDCRLKTSRRRYKKLSKRLNWGQQSLDIMKIGPSTGTFLHVANENGHRAIGCDVSNRFVQYADENYGVDIQQGRFESLGYEDQQFDIILMFNVIENIPNLDDVLTAIHRTLKPGGVFVYNHVDVQRNWVEKIQGDKYFLYRPPICYIFETPVLDRLLEDRGFSLTHRFWDVRYLSIEKILTLLRWRWLYRLAVRLGIERWVFPVWAYPSKISVVRKNP